MRLRSSLALIVLLSGCTRPSQRSVIVLAVDGMDPGFVERHWKNLPHLAALPYQHLQTTDPPQSPVAWSTFITGLDPSQHGILDFVHRDPATHEPYLSITRTTEPRFLLPLGPWQLPLVPSRVISLRRGRPFWEILSDWGVPVTILRLPANYPPSKAGHELAGMGTPDLRGTEGTFTYFTNDVSETPRDVPGGVIQTAVVRDNHADLTLGGPPNPLRRDHAATSALLQVDLDPERPYARIRSGAEMAIVKEGQWSGWLRATFPLLPHIASAHGIVSVFLKQARPAFELYVSPINLDPSHADLPISVPGSFARDLESRTGRWSTLGIPEDTAALRAGVFDLPQFLAQTRLVLDDERRLLVDALAHFNGGLLVFYFSVVDQSSHMLWQRHDAELLEFYRAIDTAVGEVRRREPNADLVVLSDHGFTSFDRAVHLNRWLATEGFGEKASALGINGLYVNDPAIIPDLRRRLLDFRDPLNGHPVILSVTETHAEPSLIVGYAAGYRASWQTAVGEAPPLLMEDNTDAWIGDHCVDPSVVPGVLFSTLPVPTKQPALRDIPRMLLAAYGENRN